MSACDERAGNRGILILCSVVVACPVQFYFTGDLRRCGCAVSMRQTLTWQTSCTRFNKQIILTWEASQKT